jgi:hypothetical protein
VHVSGELKIRFNKKHLDESDVWRIFEGEKEHNVAQLLITVPVHSTTTFEQGERKWNICCEGELTIEGGIAYIT